MIARFSGLLACIAGLCWLGMAITALPAHAVQPDEILDDPALEQRARDLSKGLRCVVCQNESIDESNAELARDMRIRVRDLLVQGYADDAIMNFMVDRYGEYVLLRPKVRPGTYLLWFGPLLIFAAASVVLVFYFKNRQPTAASIGPDIPVPTDDPQPQALSPEEQTRLSALMAEIDPKAVEQNASETPSTPQPLNPHSQVENRS